MGVPIFHHLTPYLVPIFVQAFSKASLNFKNRDMEILLRLPGEREDPAFVIDRSGLIVASTGKTKKFLEKFKLVTLFDFFNKEEIEKLLEEIEQEENRPEFKIVELYSDVAKKWYQVKIRIDFKASHLLVWLEDLTKQKELDRRLAVTRNFSNEIMNSIKEVTKANDLYERLSDLILHEGYEGVFVARENQMDSLSGLAFKVDSGGLVKSDLIEISKDSSSSLLASRKSKRVVAHSASEFDTQQAFEKAHPFDARVKDFLGFDIKSFINYHECEVSIIAFNKESELDKYDLSVMETLLNTARSATYMIDLSQENDEKFVQIITGLAAASEYSDELTGKHILRVNEYSKLLAQNLGFDEQFTAVIGQVAALHDIGKVAIPDIIKLDRKLTIPEREQMQMHPVYGAQIVEEMTSHSTHSDFRLMMARNIALNHHQQWNGKGYPGLIDDRGKRVGLDSKDPAYYPKLKPLKGNEIPIEALIVSLADKYDALRSERQYKPPFSHEKTTGILIKDDRTGSSGEDVFGNTIFNLYLDIQDRFNEIFIEGQDN